jgi:hypothetical protein
MRLEGVGEWIAGFKEVVDQEEPTTVYIAPQRITLQAAANADHIRCYKDSTSNQGDTFKKGTTPWCRRRPV